MKGRIDRLLNHLFKSPYTLELSGIIGIALLHIVFALTQIVKIEIYRKVLQSLIFFEWNTLLKLFSILIGTEIISGGISWFINYKAAQVEGKILKQLMSFVLQKNSRLVSWSKCDMGINERFTMAEGDCERYIKSVVEKASLFSDFVTIPCYIIYGCTINIPLTIFITIISIAISFMNKKNKEQLYSYNEEYNERYGYWTNFLWKAVDNLEVIRVFLNKKAIRKEQKRRNEQVDDTSNKSLVAYLNMCLVEESSDIIFTLFILCFSFVAIMQKVMLATDILAIVESLSSVQKAVFLLPEKLVQLYELESIASRIYQYEKLEEDSATDDNVEDFKKLVIRNLTFAYEQYEVLHNVNYTFQKGKFYIVVGPSGCGKSTLLKAMAKLISVQGEILWNQKNLSQIRRQALYKKLVYIPQNQVFLENTIKENICLQNKWNEDRYGQILKKCFLVEMFQKNNVDDSQVLTFRGSPLSSGECQMVSLASTLYAANEIILLDEAFSAIDPAKEQLFFKELVLLAKTGKTIILVSHRLTNLDKADQILFMENGNICEKGNFSELVRRNGKFCSWYEFSKERSNR